MFFISVCTGCVKSRDLGYGYVNGLTIGMAMTAAFAMANAMATVMAIMAVSFSNIIEE